MKMTKQVIGFDFFGKEFNVGDVVACLKPGNKTSWLVYGIVVKISDKTSLVFTDAYNGSEYNEQKLKEIFFQKMSEKGDDLNEIIKDKIRVHRRSNFNIVKHPENINVLTEIIK